MSSSLENLVIDGFPVVIDVPVRFKDIDVGGHAHHSHALVYFEEARAEYWSRVTGRSGLEGVDYILAEVNVRYRARILWPQTLRVGARIRRLTRKTFEMEYEACSEAGDVLVSGSSVQVMFDYEAGHSMGMPEAYRAAIAELDPGSGVPVSSRSSEQTETGA